MRLARFNIQAGSVDKRYFVGMPSPAAATVPASTIFAYPSGFQEPIGAIPVLALVLVPAFLMVSTMIIGLAHAHQRERRKLAREVEERRRAEDAVRAFNMELEQRVKERTAQLEYTTGIGVPQYRCLEIPQSRNR